MVRSLLHERPRRVTTGRSPWFNQLGRLLRRHDLTLVSAGNMLVSFTFGGAISTFFPLYASNAGMTEAMIGTLFAIRALVSAAGRIPNSIVTRRVGNLPILLGALVLQIVVMFGIAQTTDTILLAILLALDGLAFGGYLVAGQTWVADRTELDYRGAAVGLYSSASSIGGILAPLLLGLVAEIWSVDIVFIVNGWIMVAGALAFFIAATALRRQLSDQTAPD
jgi:DHA1 family multidrug resistance protein-like MFS transporter